jgi:hypothetical protein
MARQRTSPIHEYFEDAPNGMVLPNGKTVRSKFCKIVSKRCRYNAKPKQGRAVRTLMATSNNSNLINHLRCIHPLSHKVYLRKIKQQLKNCASERDRARRAEKEAMQAEVAARRRSTRSSSSAASSSSSSQSADDRGEGQSDYNELLDEPEPSTASVQSLSQSSSDSSSSSSAPPPQPATGRQRDIRLLHCIEEHALAPKYQGAYTAVSSSTSVAASVAAPPPFPYMSEVFGSLYRRQEQSSTRQQLQVWNVQMQEMPNNMDKNGPHAVQALHKVFKTPSHVHEMTRRPINVPDNDTAPHRQKKRSYAQLVASQPARSPMGELAFLDSMRSGTSDTKQEYIRDVEGASEKVWGYLLLSTEGGSAVKRRRTKAPVQHFLNGNLFNGTDRRSLLRLMIGHVPPVKFAGFDSPSYYLKQPNSFFRMHWEQLFAPFYNYCWTGSTIWYAVMEQDRQALERYVVDEVGRRYNIDVQRLSADDRRLVTALVYSRQLFLDPFELQAHGVPVHRIQQETGQVVVGKGTVLHWGLCGSRNSLNEAVNWLPVQWLEDGLPQLVQHVNWLELYVRARQRHITKGIRIPAHRAGWYKLCFDKSVQAMVTHHTPLAYTVELCSRIRADLDQEPSDRECDYSAIDTDQLQRAKGNLTRVLDVLDMPNVQSWLKVNDYQRG